MKTEIYIIFIIILLFIGCTSTPKVTKFANAGDGILAITFSDGSTTNINISTTVKESCPITQPTIVYQNITKTEYVQSCNSSIMLNYLDCQHKVSALINDYVDCESNLSRTTTSFNGSCDTALTTCTDTLTDYTNRLNNITYYMSNFYIQNPGPNPTCTDSLFACNSTLTDLINRKNNITWYAKANR